MSILYEIEHWISKIPKEFKLLSEDDDKKETLWVISLWLAKNTTNHSLAKHLINGVEPLNYDTEVKVWNSTVVSMGLSIVIDEIRRLLANAYGLEVLLLNPFRLRKGFINTNDLILDTLHKYSLLNVNLKTSQLKVILLNVSEYSDTEITSSIVSMIDSGVLELTSDRLLKIKSEYQHPLH